MVEKTKVIEASEETFKKELSDREAKITEAETKYLSRLVLEAKEAGVKVEEKELLEIGEKGITSLIAQAKNFKQESKKVDEKVEIKDPAKVKETKSEVTDEVHDFCPEYAEGPIKVQGNEMFREWRYDWFRESYARIITGTTKAEDLY